MREITGRHYALRSEFISDFSAAKKHLTRICEYAAGTIVGDGMWRQSTINTELAGKLLDLDVDDNTDYPTFKVMMEQRITKTPGYALLVCAYAAVEKDGMKYWGENWNSDKQEYEVAHKPNGELDRLYDFLISLGYQMSDYEANEQLDFLYHRLTDLGYEMSDEEKAMRDGTHELLHRREEHDESKA